MGYNVTMSRSRAGMGGGLVLGVMLAAVSPLVAQAYCRAGIDTEGGICVESDAPRLFWPRSCIKYEFHDDVFERIPALSENEVRAITRDSFAAWSDVECNQGEFWLEQAPGTTSAEPVKFLYEAPNRAVISVLTTSEWNEVAKEGGAEAFAITYLWRDRVTGEIFDVDLALNLGTGAFGRCDQPCTDGTIDLQNTLTHEAGHVLGLGHSGTRDATMYRDATAGANFMRTLSADDEAGMCALALPAHDCTDPDQCTCPLPPPFRGDGQEGGCSISQPHPIDGPSGVLWSVSGITILSLIRIRRRRAGSSRRC